MTYDFRVSDREEAIALLVAVSDCARIVNPEFFSITNKRLISQIMVRKKLEKTANVWGLSVPQMLIRNIFKLLSNDTERFPENGIKQKKEKFASLKAIHTICEKMNCANDLDLSKAKQLKK